MTSLNGFAPGKVVLSGEYAVLLGAPALVLAVDRYASASIKPLSRGGWTVNSTVLPPSRFPTLAELVQSNKQPLLSHILKSFSDCDELPNHAELTLDTAQFSENGVKLGIGSSASILVALAEVVAHFTSQTLNESTLISIHNELQGSNGSGLDVAAARMGGLIRFQNKTSIQTDLTSGLHCTFVFTGQSTATSDMVSRFLKAIVACSKIDVSTWYQLATEVADSVTDLNSFFEALVQLNDFVFQFDQATQLGIYSAPHREALRIAENASVIYKPSGAGGGDIGMALSNDLDRLSYFKQLATQNHLLPLNLSMAKHGAILQL